jgi:hypothetical protein
VGGYIETALRFGLHSSTYVMGRLVFTDSTAIGSNAAGTFLYPDATGILNAAVLGGTLNAMGAGGVQVRGFSPALHMRLVWQAANTWRIMLSPDGISWSQVGLADLSKVMIPTQMGVFATSWGGAVYDRVTSFEYFRCSG